MPGGGVQNDVFLFGCVQEGFSSQSDLREEELTEYEQHSSLAWGKD